MSKGTWLATMLAAVALAGCAADPPTVPTAVVPDPPQTVQVGTPVVVASPTPAPKPAPHDPPAVPATTCGAMGGTYCSQTENTCPAGLRDLGPASDCAGVCCR